MEEVRQLLAQHRFDFYRVLPLEERTPEGLANFVRDKVHFDGASCCRTKYHIVLYCIVLLAQWRSECEAHSQGPVVTSAFLYQKICNIYTIYISLVFFFHLSILRALSPDDPGAQDDLAAVVPFVGLEKYIEKFFRVERPQTSEFLAWLDEHIDPEGYAHVRLDPLPYPGFTAPSTFFFFLVQSLLCCFLGSISSMLVLFMPIFHLQSSISHFTT